MDMDYRKNLRNAKHEAGHVINALELRMTLDFVTILGDGNLYEGRVCNVESHCHPMEHAQMCLGGLAGERINRKQPGRLTFAAILSGIKDDWKMACAEIKKFSTPEGVDRWANKILVESWHCIHKYKPLHE